MDIRTIKPWELQEALTLVWDVFAEFEAPDYPEEGIRSFSAFIQKAVVAEQIKQGQMQVFGAFEGKKLLGVAALRRENHLSLLFVPRETQRKGVGAALLQHCRERLQESHSQMTVNASPYAVAFYHRMGFIDLASEQTEDGIRFTPMKWEWEQC